MQNYRDLQVWQRSHRLVLAIYRMTRLFPREETYGIVAQLRRAAVSVPTNIAEGAKRVSRKDYCRFLNLAESSLAETDYLILLSCDLGYIESDAAKAMAQECDEILRMLSGLREKVEATEKRDQW